MASAADAPTLTARRARWFVTMQLVLACALLALGAAVLGRALRDGEHRAVAALFAGMIAVYWWQCWRHWRDRAAVIEVRPDGLLLPSASPTPIPWPAIGRIAIGRFPFAGQIDVQASPDVVARLRLSPRFLGEFVVKRRGLDPGFAILTRGLDRNAEAIVAAIRRHWVSDTGS